MNTEEILKGLILGSVVIAVIGQFTSCASDQSEQTTQRTKMMLDAGCSKEPVPGMTGTDWVCKGE